MKVLIIDNRDSFTYNLSQLAAKVTNCDTLVIENNNKQWRELIKQHQIQAVLISPGPGSPEYDADFGICKSVIRECELPLLGVCLGHQGIGYAYGARITRAPTPMHGRVSTITHDGSTLFSDIPEEFNIVRYHSLCVEKESMPSCLRVNALAQDGVIMALSHVERPQYGVQFHPESICTEYGEQLLRNFLGTVPVRKTIHAKQPRQSWRKDCKAAKEIHKSLRPDLIHTRTLGHWVDPQRAFEQLFANSQYSFWLDSAEVIPGYSRFSFMGDASGPNSAVLTYSTHNRLLRELHHRQWTNKTIESLLPHLRQRLARPVQLPANLPFEFMTGLVGFFGYELRNELGMPANHISNVPDAVLIEADRCLAFDHLEKCVYLLARTQESDRSFEQWFDSVIHVLETPPQVVSSLPANSSPMTVFLLDGPQQYSRKIHECQEHLQAGDSYEICLTSEFSTHSSTAHYEVYKALRQQNSAPYAAFMRFGELSVLSSSPERFLKLSSNRTISTKPIKGTSPRGKNPQDDAKLAEWLRSDEKSQTENLMIIDLMRNDIGRVAATNSVKVSKLMDVESYATVHQLVSTATGRLREDFDILDCLGAAFPGGSMTGAPKIRTVSILDKMESRARGPYSGAMGFLSYGERMDLSIVIRTIVMSGSHATVATGGAIVTLSDPDSEFEEMLLKATAPLNALAFASAGKVKNWNLEYKNL